jgi:hypothetical protein
MCLKGVRMKIKIFFILLLISSNILAVSAIPGIQIFSQPNGSTFTGELKGDEYFNWVEDSLGRVIQFNPMSTNYEYSVITESNGVFSMGYSGVLATDNNSLSTSSYNSNQIVGIVDMKKFYSIARKHRFEALN